MARKTKPTAGTPATVALAAAGIDFTPHVYVHDPGASSYGGEAAQALGLAPQRVFKTLVVDLDAELVVGIVPVSGQLVLKALARALGGSKAAMADPRAAERSSGYVTGGISPIGQKKPLRTVLDASALEHPTIFVSGGRRGFDVELSAADLINVTRAVIAPIGR